MSKRIQKQRLKYFGSFALIDGPYDKKQHTNQQKGLDQYVLVLNIETGQICSKKLYLNSKGLHFKHTGHSPVYLEDMLDYLVYVPYQVVDVTELDESIEREVSELRLNYGKLEHAVRLLLSDVKERYPGEELHCPHMRSLDRLVYGGLHE